MKILGVKFANINALLGEWEIHFDRPPLADTNLFAIVGANGSGKSSILDALTLALYGETARLKSPESTIMNWRAEACYAEVTFSVAEGLYRSRWSLRKAAGGLEAAEMSLVGLNGGETLLEDKVIRVRSRIAEVTGLDFKRFCRSILLAQGDFAAFLNALESERAEILEKIIGAEVAQELEESFRTRAMIENDRLLQLKEAAAASPVPDTARLNAVREERDQAQQELEETVRALEQLEELEARLERVEGLEASARAEEEALAAAQARAAETAREFERLEQARPALPLGDDLKRVEELQAEADVGQRRFAQVEEGIVDRQARLVELEEQRGESRMQLARAQQQLDDRGAELLNATLQDQEIAAASEQFLDCVTRYEALERSMKANVEQQSDVESRIAHIDSRRRELQRWFDEHAADAGLEGDIPAMEALLARLATTQRELEARRAEIKSAVTTERRSAKELKRAERAVRKVRHRIDRLDRRKADRAGRLDGLLGHAPLASWVDDLQRRKKQLSACGKLVRIGRRYERHGFSGNARDALAEIQSQRDALTHTLAQEQARLKELEGHLRWRDTLQQYVPARAALRPGCPCPLCGAVEHPYVEGGVPDFTELESAMGEQEKRLAALQAELGALAASAAVWQRQAEAQGNLERAWAATCAEAGGEWQITAVDRVQEEIRSGRADYKRLKATLRAARWRKWRVDWVGRALERRMGRLARREQLKDSARAAHESRQKAVADLQGVVQQLAEEQRHVRADLVARLEHWGQPAPQADLGAGVMRPLEERWELYRAERQEQAALAAQWGALEAQRAALPREHERLQSEAGRLAAQSEEAQARLVHLKADREALYGDLKPASERQALEGVVAFHVAEEAALTEEIDALRRVLAEERERLPEVLAHFQETRRALEDAERTLLDWAAASGFSSLDEVREQLRVVEEMQGAAEAHAAAQRVLIEAGARAAAAQGALAAARSERQEAPSLAMVRSRIAETQKHRDMLQEAVDAAERILDEQHAADREYRQTLQAIAVQEKICHEALAEEDALLAGDAAETRRRRQRVMLERLVDQANRHLAVLSDRYQLRPADADGLGLQVEDALQGRTLRPAKTLSGGESFLVSLCLALGLADMAGRHRRIESLFLDEGFGALDDETLYRVTAALKALRADGKTVGIISHVKRLADEIPTQIRVDKIPGGLSRITVVA